MSWFTEVLIFCHYVGKDESATGFTLIEMMVVLAILALLAIVVPPLLTTGSGFQLLVITRGLSSDLRILREESRQRHLQTSLEISTHAFKFLPDRRTELLRPDVTATFTADEPMLMELQTPRIIFYPDGSSSGGKITLRAGNITRTVLVRWLDGAVLVYD